MKYRIASLGCKVNQYETQALETLLRDRGFLESENGECADVVIVNTCAVTAESGRKSRRLIRKLAEENPGALVAVCGCFSQLSPEETAEIGADVVHGSGGKARFVEDIARALRERQKIAWTDDPFARRSLEELPAGAVDGRTRAMLKIQDGCVNFCTFCIIPYTRGRVRSLPPERCAAQTRALAEKGFRELVLTGIEIASYGKDLTPQSTLAGAVEVICANAGGLRVRLGSLEPTVVTEDFAARLKAAGRVCEHFHLSLQSGCDEVLKNMNRKYDTVRFYEAVQTLRGHFPGCGITADLIAGFPGETAENHAETLAFIKKCGFSSMHVFPYSRRPGTKAAGMGGQLTNAVKAERARQAQAAARAMAEDFMASCVGRELSVLFETEKDGMSIGHAANYARVCVPGGRLRGLVKNVEIIDASGKMLVGKMV
ncbi:MAG: tRNA (N(6)-L-threonylcarbamoyladenosine(37)-C(2))-methylthiotransferase MtaB [Oscillospiraceae bacterium]|jgi:threonylcarbamoyladenosine tRNA methylthiotransferase MtaB|nr:tRNA (N(6)-L-threonylcarbamoyladenosine(37)-C(2))-methylthiotransferase MtaB [Oscillospiraceae bacterium]